ncbi:hypothetical protein E2C01_007389 [Portunus trituberculatus]|uniref:Uncharacterized protein n=1 Tax=Portunus trituberculatus TaxID=210409 RepID=A0A5B7D0D7_PORTR|nr:hypothetical protein [Portunus trituberculatus]
MVGKEDSRASLTASAPALQPSLTHPKEVQTILMVGGCWSGCGWIIDRRGSVSTTAVTTGRRGDGHFLLEELHC